MQGYVFHIRFNRTCNAYTHHETISHLDSVAADIVDNSNSNTLLALVAVTKALGEAAQQRLHDEDKREAVPDQSRMLLIPTMAFPFHPAYYVQEPTLSVPVVLTDYEQRRLNNIRANKEALKALNLWAGPENQHQHQALGEKSGPHGRCDANTATSTPVENMPPW